jgi:hypothetical protein
VLEADLYQNHLFLLDKSYHLGYSIGNIFTVCRGTQPMKHAERGISYSPREARIKNKEASFTKQKVSFDDTPLFFPEGFEKLFLAIYFVTLPYVAGLLFLFFYVAEGKTDLFLSLNRSEEAHV